jgi:quercetin dioxygenase-like cupin family protein
MEERRPRRRITGLRQDGTSSFVVDETLEPVRPWYGGMDVFPAWEADLPFELPEGERQSPATGHIRVVVVRYFPGQSPELPFSQLHWHDTVDVQILIEGELVQRLDDGSEVTMKPGDVIIQQGTAHAWEARGEEGALLAIILHDANRVGATPPEERHADRVLRLQDDLSGS